jgi:hypothetical protein
MTVGWSLLSLALDLSRVFPPSANMTGEGHAFNEIVTARESASFTFFDPKCSWQ